MQKTLEFTINRDGKGRTIERFLELNSVSGKMMVQLKKKPENVLLNGSTAKLNQVLNEGDLLIVLIHEKNEESRIIPWNIDLNVVYEDDEIAVINKPAGMPVHPSRRHPDTTLANALVGRYGSVESFHCITRLDKDTSGLVLIARNRYSSAVLSEMMKNREIEKEYLAVVCGEISERGTIDLPIYRAGLSVKRSVDMDKGLKAVTQFTPIRYYTDNDVTLVRIHTLTGRTHQIRVHMAYIGHPLCGDSLYNNSPGNLTRQALHAYKLSFMHPTQKKPLVFEAELPDDLKEILF